MTNMTNCDYDVHFGYAVKGAPNPSVVCTIPANGTAVVCYDPTTTYISAIETILSGTGQGAWLGNPGYPGSTSASISNGGCQGGDFAYWENASNQFTFGHIANIIIFP